MDADGAGMSDEEETCGEAVRSRAAALLGELRRLREEVDAEGRARFEAWLPHMRRRAYRLSALNLAHYLALRRHDLRPLQSALMPLGLSSLGRSESRVIPTLDATAASLACLAAMPAPRPHPGERAFFRGERLLSSHADALLGPPAPGHEVRIMVTLPDDAAGNPRLLRDLVTRGMDVARINCAHGAPEDWAAMAAAVRRAAAEAGRSCRIQMDLCGPRARTGAVAALDPERRLGAGDRLVFTPEPPTVGPDTPFQVQLSLPEVVADLHVGHRICIDGGKIVARIVGKRPDGLLAEVVQVSGRPRRVRSGKGLNFPDSALRLSPLTGKDLRDLDTVVGLADIIGYSFVQRPGDIERLQQELENRGRSPETLGLVAKIETATAIANLPELIVAGAGRQPFGVMIARGDLAVEIGHLRLTELQEELLWLCEAAQVPVVWATEVMSRFVRKGTPSRAEMTDAAMAQRAECVMLNKGPYLVEAIALLDEVLTRMAGHQSKKTPRLRALRTWQAQAPGGRSVT
mgnify:CR=1 FL=1